MATPDETENHRYAAEGVQALEGPNSAAGRTSLSNNIVAATAASGAGPSWTQTSAAFYAVFCAWLTASYPYSTMT